VTIRVRNPQRQSCVKIQNDKKGGGPFESKSHNSWELVGNQKRRGRSKPKKGRRATGRPTAYSRRESEAHGEGTRWSDEKACQGEQNFRANIGRAGSRGEVSRSRANGANQHSVEEGKVESFSKILSKKEKDGSRRGR